MLGLTGNNLVYTEIRKLLKKATVHAKEKDYDSAIVSLLKAYRLMETCSTEWGIRTYFRAARYHHLAERYDDALNWLQTLHDNVDTTADAREELYKKWGWMQKGGPSKVSKKIRDTYRKIINNEIELLMTRQQKIEQRARKIR